MPHSHRRIVSVRAVIALALLGLVAAASVSGAPIQRTFVKSTGADTNPCNLVSPCRSFNVAIANTLPGGEVVILDTAGYGPMLIDKAIKIIGPTGVYGGISAINPGADGITINAGDNDIVTLRGLDVTGLGSLYGINVLNADTVYIQATSVSGFFQGGGACVHMNTARGMGLVIVDSFLHECSDGLRVNASSVANRVVVDVENTRLVDMGAGLSLSGNYAVNLRNSTVITGGLGILTSDTIDGTFSRLNVDDSLFTTNFNGAIKTTGSGTAAPIVAISNSRFHQNFALVLHGFGTVSIDRITSITGSNSFVNCGSGSIISAGNNTINLMGDTTLPGGCASFITSFSTIVPK
jgi:hypothetical protein